jgi:hypothetical protein
VHIVVILWIGNIRRWDINLSHILLFLIIFIIYEEDIMTCENDDVSINKFLVLKRHKHQWKYYSHDRSKNDENMRECICGKHQRLTDTKWENLRYEYPDISGYPKGIEGKLLLLCLTLILFVLNFAGFFPPEYMIYSFLGVLFSLACLFEV